MAKDGIEALANIRKEELTNKHTPVIPLTADAIKGAEERLRSFGFDDYLSKPVKIADLAGCLDNAARQLTNSRD